MAYCENSDTAITKTAAQRFFPQRTPAEQRHCLKGANDARGLLPQVVLLPWRGVAAVGGQVGVLLALPVGPAAA
eukprot:scaffold32_cov200-Pinguiococcus_pyrenoidosus.AAC.3